MKSFLKRKSLQINYKKMDQESLIDFTPGINKVQSMMKQADKDSISIDLSN